MTGGVKVALISGTSIVKSTQFSAWEVRTVETKHGVVTVWMNGEHAVLNRHGSAEPVPAHAINHRANLAALAELGFADVVALNSVGSLRPELTPGTFVSCSDYVGLAVGPLTLGGAGPVAGSPGVANNLIPRLVAELAPEFMVRAGKIYVQTRGPRFETKAEIAIIRNWGDVVGMTMAHEADLATELGLRYNSLALVDNFANGLVGTDIDYVRFKELVADNQERVDRFVARVFEILG